MAALAVALLPAPHQRRPRAARSVRVLGAAAMPALAATLLFTFSRGPMIALTVGVVAYALIGRPRLLITGLLGGRRAHRDRGGQRLRSRSARVRGYRAGRSRSHRPHEPAGGRPGPRGGRGHRALRARRRRAARPAPAPRSAAGAGPAAGARTPARARRPAWSAVVVLAAGVWIGLDASERLAAGSTPPPSRARPPRPAIAATGCSTRASRASSCGRWRWSATEPPRCVGQGAGTYEVLWARHRSNDSYSYDAHSVFLESLAEVGIVGSRAARRRAGDDPRRHGGPRTGTGPGGVRRRLRRNPHVGAERRGRLVLGAARPSPLWLFAARSRGARRAGQRRRARRRRRAALARVHRGPRLRGARDHRRRCSRSPRRAWPIARAPTPAATAAARSTRPSARSRRCRCARSRTSYSPTATRGGPRAARGADDAAGGRPRPRELAAPVRARAAARPGRPRSAARRPPGRRAQPAGYRAGADRGALSSAAVRVAGPLRPGRSGFRAHPDCAATRRRRCADRSPRPASAGRGRA